MAPYRTFAPEPDVLGKAALLSEIPSRQQHYGNDSKLRALMDCVLLGGRYNAVGPGWCACSRRLLCVRKASRVRPNLFLDLQAQKLGFTVLTGNIGDFDLLFQMVPAGRVLFYRRRK